MREFVSNAKLLLTGEYLVMDGALALALPIKKYNQRLVVTQNKNLENTILWKSFDSQNNIWFSSKICINKMAVIETNNVDISDKLIEVLKFCKRDNPSFLNVSNGGFCCEMYCNFDLNWGLGTSSTFVNNIAQWAETNPYKLQFKVFGGSGYDIACANENTPIFYKKKDNNIHAPYILKADFNPSFSNELYFVYLGLKQNSRDEISNYEKVKISIDKINEISSISQNILKCKNLSEFEKLLDTHEQIMSNILQRKTVKQKLFSKYKGSVKSLGAWGGDFVLVTKRKGFDLEFENYLKISYNNMMGL